MSVMCQGCGTELETWTGKCPQCGADAQIEIKKRADPLIGRIISGKYKIRILWDLKDGPLRYNELRRGLLRGTAGTPEIAARVLSRELKALTQTGLIDRKDYGA